MTQDQKVQARLKSITGVGPKNAQLLASAGCESVDHVMAIFKDQCSLDPEKFREHLKVRILSQLNWESNSGCKFMAIIQSMVLNWGSDWDLDSDFIFEISLLCAQPLDSYLMTVRHIHIPNFAVLHECGPGSLSKSTIQAKLWWETIMRLKTTIFSSKLELYFTL